MNGDRVLRVESSGLHDPAWDRFLRHTSLGHFQQASAWARYKSFQGWHCGRDTFFSGDSLVGGYQVLWKKRGPFRIGYVTKGPVLAEETPALAQRILDSLLCTVKRLKLGAVIVQPPDGSTILPALLSRCGFLEEQVMNVIQATQLIDVRPGIIELEKTMRRTTVQQVKKARKRGVIISERDERELGVFFRLMLESCKRQGGVQPNPSSETALKELWRFFHAHGGIRLTFAECAGEAIAGLLCIPFGNRVTLWKKGSSPEYFDHFPVSLLYHEALSWSERNGYTLCDFAAMNLETARDILEGKLLGEKQRQSRDFFNLGFGGYPSLLPPTNVLFGNQVLSCVYRAVFSPRWMRGQAKRLLNR